MAAAEEEEDVGHELKLLMLLLPPLRVLKFTIGPAAGGGDDSARITVEFSQKSYSKL